MNTMDTTIRNIDPEAYRQLKARAALEGKSLGEAVSEAIRVWAEGRLPFARTGSLRQIQPWSWGAGSERTSEEVDRLVYGARR